HDVTLGDVSFTLLAGRQRFECAVTHSVETVEELIGALDRAAPSDASIEGVDIGLYFAGSGARRVPLPVYPFARERYWCTEMTPSERPLLFAADDRVAPPAALAPPVVTPPAALRKEEYARFLADLRECPRTFAWRTSADAPGENAIALLAFAQALAERRDASLPPIVVDASADPALAALAPSLRLADARLEVIVGSTRTLR